MELEGREIYSPEPCTPTCTVYEYVFEQCNPQQLFRVRSKVTGKPNVRDIWGISVGRFGKHLRGILAQKKTGFQMLNEDEIVTSVQEESDPVVNETDEDEDNNNN
ncbi:UNVERIFIED_CONTAM: hypothetical protein NCL1_24273 [Trichonephila clavipes]